MWASMFMVISTKTNPTNILTPIGIPPSCALEKRIEVQPTTLLRFRLPISIILALKLLLNKHIDRGQNALLYLFLGKKFIGELFNADKFMRQL